MHRTRFLALALTLSAAALLSGCPENTPPSVLGTWDYIEDALDGSVRWNIRLNGTIEQTNLGNGTLAGNLTWVMTSPNDIVIYQDNGPNQYLLTGTIYVDDFMSGTWVQTAGDDTGIHGTWSATRFP
ncbi:MAG: hypothetical protein IT364_09995 [Candidatus Hydrogenedentes bacterium]|nr:hypothetical protein [Candidatus Hydrogenedentota bacterium]